MVSTHSANNKEEERPLTSTDPVMVRMVGDGRLQGWSWVLSPPKEVPPEAQSDDTGDELEE
jgi:hypothetical protein